MKAYFTIAGGRLVPAEPRAEKLLAKYDDGAEVIADVHQPKDPAFLKKWWRLMKIFSANMPDRFVDERAVSDLVLLGIHEVHFRQNPVTLDVRYIPKSLADMDAETADSVWRRGKLYVHENWLPIGSEKLQQEVDDFFAGPEGRRQKAERRRAAA